MFAQRPAVSRISTDATIPSVSTAPSLSDDLVATTSLQMSRPETKFMSESHRKIVMTDPVAFRYLEEDEDVVAIVRRVKLEGYELYCVEQWACSRTHPTFTICTYTGDPSHSILVNVLAVPVDEESWSKRLKVYFEAVSQSYVKEKETPLGTLMVTNLNGFPSSLTVVSVPDGDIKKHREDFIVNENLKRMGCSGRAAMSLQFPQSSTIARFHHLYKTSEKIPVYSAVLEIVRYCQIALVLYGKLSLAYADGLLCDPTETAISGWWNEIGLDFHNVEPSDGAFGPTTVAALIGLLVGAYNRLKETGSPVGKDPLDLSTMKKAIGHFQKSYKIDRTRRLDRATLDRLHRVTAKSATEEGGGVSRAIKSTIGTVSGKGGEMIARGLIGGKEKPSIAEVETLDIDQLSQLVVGGKLRWLWQGKELKHPSISSPPDTDDLNGKVFATDERGNFLWTSETHDHPDEFDGLFPEHESKKRDRLREAVGLGSTHRQQSRVNSPDPEPAAGRFLGIPDLIPSRQHSKDYSSKVSTPAYSTHEVVDSPIPMDDSLEGNAETRGQLFLNGLPDRHTHRQALRGFDHIRRESPTERKIQEELSHIRDALQASRYQDFSDRVSFRQPESKILRRTQSASQLREIVAGRVARLPRQLSLSIVVDPLSYQPLEESISEDDDAATSRGLQAQMKAAREKLRKSQDLARKLIITQRGLMPFTEIQVRGVESLEKAGQAQLDEMKTTYYQHLEEYQALQATSTDLVARERSALNESMRRIEMLVQKLDYEISSLQAHLQEVEQSVDDFERSVQEVENNVKMLVQEQEAKPSWLQFFRSYWGSVRIAKASPE